MNTTSRWLWTVLFAFLQVATLLVVEMCLFSWFRNESHDVITARVFRENVAILENLQTREFLAHATDPDWESRTRNLTHRTEVPDSGFVSAYEQDGEGRIRIDSESIFREWQPVTRYQLASRTEEDEGPPPTYAWRSGLLDVNGTAYLVTAVQMAEAPGGLAVLRNREVALRPAEQAIAYAHRVGFGVILLLGLASSLAIYTNLTCFKNRLLRINEDLQARVRERAEQLAKSKNAVIFGLAKLAESRDTDTGEHLDRIRSYVTLLAEDLVSVFPEIDEVFIENLAIASSLHDIGKVGIPDAILLKPGRLTEKERSIMELHAVIGGECLEAIQARLGDNDFMTMATQVAYSHHERWDGTGYPHGLAEDEIPLEARIVSVADVYDALTSKRPYKKAMNHTESRAIIVAGSGTQFDPEVVAAFLRHEDDFRKISIKQQFVNDEQATSEFQRLAEAVARQTEEERNRFA